MTRLKDIALLTFALCATGAAVARLRAASPRPSVAGESLSAEAARMADSLAERSVSSEAVTIVVFTDYECPACQRFERSSDSALAHRPGVHLVVKHFPLETVHFHAFDAAVHAECARAQHRFAAMHQQLMRADYAFDAHWSASVIRASGIPDAAAFARCLDDPAVALRVRRDVAAGDGIGVHATPTIVVGHTRYTGALSGAQLEAILNH